MSFYYNTPGTQSGFSVYMNQKFDEREVIAVQSAWQSFFPLANPKYARDAATLAIDIIRGNQRMTALIKRAGANGVSLDQKVKQDGKYTNVNRLFPLAEEKSVISANDLLKRQAGESPESGRTRMERARSIAQDHFAENLRKGIRLNEYLAATAMQSGIQPYIIGDTDDVIDYLRSDSNVIACTDEWDDTGAVPLTDIYAGCAQAKAAGKSMPDMLVLAPNSANALFNETSIKALADVKGFSFIAAGNMQVPPQYQRFVDGGFVFVGRLTLPQGITLYCFVDHGTYDNASGTSTPYMTTATALLCNSKTRYDLIIGPPEQFPMTESERNFMDNVLGVDPDFVAAPANTSVLANVSGGFTHDIYFGDERKHLFCRTQSAFVFAPVHTDSIVQLTGCAITS